MNVASLDLCKELFKVSGWLGKENADHYWYKDEEGKFEIRSLAEAEFYHADEYYPIYPLGYLLRKLPRPTYVYGVDMIGWINWCAKSTHEYKVDAQFAPDSPEDAACKLAIELFKQGILTRETTPNPT